MDEILRRNQGAEMMTLQMHMNPTVILPEPTPDTDAEPTGGIGRKTTMRVFGGEQDEKAEEPAQ